MTQHAYARQAGRIEVICGGMFSGKTTCLIERVSIAAAGRRFLAFKHLYDRRYDRSAITAHDGSFMPARPVCTVDTIESAVRDETIIAIDEAQFFAIELVAACERLRKAGKTVICSGLRFDWWGRPFPTIAALCDVADSVLMLRARCSSCGAPADHSQRLTPLTPDTAIGGIGTAEPRCATHFVPLNAAGAVG